MAPSKDALGTQDYIVTAENEKDATRFFNVYMRSTERGLLIADTLVIESIARANLSKHKAGFVEYRGATK